jgi:hypothetical protein
MALWFLATFLIGREQVEFARKKEPFVLGQKQNYAAS